MNYLLHEAQRLNVTVEMGMLPTPEVSRYIHEERRIILQVGLANLDLHEALAVALGHAYHGDVVASDWRTGRAEDRAVEVLLAAVGLLPELSAWDQMPAGEPDNSSRGRFRALTIEFFIGPLVA